MADKVSSAEDSSSDTNSSPTSPPPTRHKKSSKLPPTTSKGRHRHSKHKHGGRKGKKKSKGKRKYVTSSSSSTSSSSHDSTDSESPDRHHATRDKLKRAHHSKTVGKSTSQAAEQESKQSDLFAVYRKHSSKLVDVTSTCVSTITSKLFARNLIPEDVQGQVITGQGSDHDKAVKVLYAVQQQIKSDPEKLRTLVQVLQEEPVFDDLTKKITDDIKSLGQEEMITPKRMSTLSRYKQYLKSVYDCDPIACDDKLAISPCSDFISLALVHKEQSYSHDDAFSKSTFHGGVDQILASKTPLELDALVTPGSPFVLVEGPPGIGKSTMCWELCRKWETLKSLQDFKIVLQLKLREKRVQNATSLHQLFHHDDRKLCEGIVDLVLSCDGEGVLLVLDGFDELPSSVVGDESSLIMRLIRGQCLPSATRLVTSRPSALHQKKRYFPQEYRHVEILGFTDECKLQFAEKAFKADPKILALFKKFIFSNPIITSLMYIPVHCAIIAQVYKDLPDITVPKTMTQLYTLLVLVLIRRHLIQTVETWTEQSKVPDNLEGLPEDIRAELMRVSKLAYEGLMKNDVQIMFSDEDVGERFQHLGLLNEAKEMYVSKGAVTYYSFLHLSIQEFLAAWHVKCHQFVKCHQNLFHFIADGIHDIFSKWSTWQIFQSFLSGMLCYGFNVDFLTSPSMSGLLQFFNWDSMNVISRCYEAQNVKGLNYTNCQISIFKPLDMYMFGYVLVHAPIQWTLTTSAKFLDMLASSIVDYAPADGIINGSVGLSLEDIEIELGSLPKFLREFILRIHLTDDTAPVIPFLPNLTIITISCENKISKHTINSLWKIMKLTGIVTSTEKSDDIPMELVQGLCRVFNWSSTIEEVVINANGQKFWNLQIWNLQRIIEAALCCSSLKSFFTTVPFFAVRYSSSITELNYNPIFSTMDYLSSIADMCKTMSKVSVCLKHATATTLAVWNGSLHSNPSIDVNVLQPYIDFSLSDLPSLSRALRKDPDVIRLNLRRSKSLPDLTTQQLSFREGITGHQSCPDLLEMQSLHNMHPKLCEAISSHRFYQKHVLQILL